MKVESKRTEAMRRIKDLLTGELKSRDREEHRRAREEHGDG